MHLAAHIIAFIKTYESWGYVIVFLTAFGETLPFIGIILPGVFIVGFFGVLAAQGYFDAALLIIASSVGAILGDICGYWLGTKGTRLFKNENKILKRSHLEKGEQFFAAHGNKSVFLARFISPLRPIIPFVAGLSRMDWKTFLVWNAAGGILWSIVIILLGYFFGSAFIGIARWWIKLTTFVFVLLAFWAIIVIARRSGKNSASE